MNPWRHHPSHKRQKRMRDWDAYFFHPGYEQPRSDLDRKAVFFVIMLLLAAVGGGAAFYLATR